MLEDDTIAAIATPLGMGGIGIVKISGPKAFVIAGNIFRKKTPSSKTKSHHLYYGDVIDPHDGSVIDEALLSFMEKPHSYTAEDVVEINCHSSFIVLQRILEVVLNEGVRLADPGEFTKRAFINGRIDLSQAEAVVDVITSQTETSLQIATQQLKGTLSKEIKELKEDTTSLLSLIEASIDFPEEDLELPPLQELLPKLDEIKDRLRTLIESYEEGRLYKEGISAIIIGKPNVGKSSLLNALLRERRAIVTPVPGTTRDLIEGSTSIKGFPLKIIDTAGIGETTDIIEEEGMKLAKEKISSVDLVIFVIDSSQDLGQGDCDLVTELKNKKMVIALNKMDLASKASLNDLNSFFHDYNTVPISALYCLGIDELKEAIFNAIVQLKLDSQTTVFISNNRHKIAFEMALKSIIMTRESIVNKMSPEFAALDMHVSLRYMGEITGETTSEDILDRIFSEFCVGK